MKADSLSIMADSQQNLVEVYTKRRYLQKRTNIEKHLWIAIALLLILFIIFFVLFLIFQQYYYRLVDEAICTSKECIESAMMLLQTVNFSQDPCHDFYNYACGNFGQTYSSGSTYSHSSWFMERELRLIGLVQRILNSPTSESDIRCVRKTKLFYQSCTNESELDRLGLEPLFDLLELVELPRSIPTREESETFNLGKTLALAQRYLSQDILVTVSITRNESLKNATILRLSPGTVGLNGFRQHKHDGDILANVPILRGNVENDEPDSIQRRSTKNVILATISFICDILREISRELEQNDLNTTEYVSTAFKIITFSSELVKDWNEKYNATEDPEDQYMTFANLQVVLDEESRNDKLSNKIDWGEYISTLFEKVNSSYDLENDIVVIENMEYFKYLSRVLGAANPLSIQRHVWWKLIEEFGRYTTTNMRLAYSKYSREVYGDNIVSSRSHTCTIIMKKLMTVALSHQMAVMNDFSTTVTKVRQMLKDIENVFGSLVLSLTWMDAETKAATLDKAHSIKDEIGYAEWLLDSDRVDRYYDGLVLKKTEFLKNIIRVNEWEVEKVLLTIGPEREASNKTIGWFSNPLQVNAYYSRTENTITIPLGILQTPFYFRGLESMNYGAIGSILGHELTHGFDIDGKNYNKFGEKLDNNWPKRVTEEFENRAKCFVNQYEKYNIRKNKKLNGTVTLAENIADNGGMRESFKAYQLYTSRHAKEPKLPGFENFSQEQLLFLSFAHIWCEDSSKDETLNEDTHSPHRIRVLATLQNMREFADAYNCPFGSFMNPKEKCIIW